MCQLGCELHGGAEGAVGCGQVRHLTRDEVAHRVP